MNKKKKEWMKAVNARKKAERLARREAALGADPEPVVQPAVLPDADLPSEPELVAAAEKAADDLGEALALAKAARSDQPGAGSDELTDDEARAMLVRAARLLDDVVVFTRETLDMVPEARRREAEAIIAETRAPRAVEGSPQKRPRRGADPVVTLMKVGMQAASLQQRILGRTNPNLGKVRKVA